jgi:hypothetical protein
MANTYSSSLVVDVATQAAITTLQPRLAALKSFASDFSDEVISGAGLRKLQVGVVQNAAAAVTNPTSFESTGDTVNAAPVQLQHISAQFGLTSADLNKGFRLERILKANLRALANAVMDVALAPIGSGTAASPKFASAYSTAVTTSNALPGNTFISGALGSIWSSISNSSSKALILDGSYYQYLLPQTGFNLDVAMKGAYGFENGIFLNNRWSGVTAGTDNNLNGTSRTIKGFVASQESLAMAAALPYVDPAVAGLLQQQEVIEIPDLGLSVQFNVHGSLASRSLFGTFDVLFGSAAADTSALKTISA